MKHLRLGLLLLAVLTLFTACAKAPARKAAKAKKTNISKTMTQTPDNASVKVEVSTTAGDFTILLYGDTPRHRDNFVKLVKEGYYNGTLFHRVIKDFMIQAGDPDSRTAKPGQQLGAGGPDYKIDAEILFPTHFHKRGALAAARQGDQVNPAKQSSGSQFYVVTGRKSSAAELAQMEKSMKNRQMQSVFNRLVGENRSKIMEMQQRGDNAGLQELQNDLIAQTEAEVNSKSAPGMTEEMKKAYTTVGGAPHLDGEYTVFGEVLSGMETIDKIEKAATDRGDRPKEDIRILSMKIVK